MTTRSRTIARQDEADRSSSNPPTTIGNRLRSKHVRERGSPYGSLTRRSSATGNQSTTFSSTVSTNNQNDFNNTSNVSILNSMELSRVELSDEDSTDNDQESTLNTMNSLVRNVNLSNNDRTDSTTNVDPNQALNYGNATSIVVGNHQSMINSVMSNEELFKLFDQTQNGMLQCKICQKVFKRKHYSTTNLRKHVGFVHEQPNFLYPSQRKSGLSKISEISPQQRKELNEAVISCIIKDSRSFDDFRKKGMLEFLNKAIPGYVPPHRLTVREHIIRRYQQHKKNLRKVFAKVQEVALTCDVWQNSRGTHFISITAHFFDVRYNSVCLTIGFRQIIGDHISERLRCYILYELRSLKIEKKICSITTDNASNIIAATANCVYFGDRLSCLAHNMNLIVNDGLHLHEKSRNSPSTLSQETNDTINTTNCEVDDVDSGSSEEDECDDGSDAGLTSSSSVGHGEEQSDDSFEDHSETSTEDVDDREEIVGKVSQLTRRVRGLVRLSRRTNFIRFYLRNEARTRKLVGQGLILDCFIRWNSTFYMIDRFINYQPLINQMTSNPRLIWMKITTSMIRRLEELSFCYEEWELLVATRNVLSIFEEACRLVSGRKYQTLSIGYLVLIGLEHHLSQTITNERQATLETIIRKSLFDAYKHHINDKINSIQKKAMMIACYLDPETYHVMADHDKDQAYDFILQETQIRIFPSATVSRSTTNSRSDRSTQSNTKLNSFLTGCGLKSRAHDGTNSNSSRSIKEEIIFYINKVKNPIRFQDFWIENESEIPHLANLVRSFNIRPVTSVASESLFSMAGYVNRKQRCSLSPDMLRYSMLLLDEDVVASLL